MKLNDLKIVPPKSVQRYRLRMSEDNFENARPGQFVFRNNASNQVSGFISAVDSDRYEMEICTFDPVPLTEYMIRVVDEMLTMDQIKVLLQQALEKNPEMKSEWATALTNS